MRVENAFVIRGTMYYTSNVTIYLQCWNVLKL